MGREEGAALHRPLGGAGFARAFSIPRQLPNGFLSHPLVTV